MVHPGFSAHFCHSFPLVGEVPAVTATKTSDAIYLPKANESSSKVMENHLLSQPKLLLLAPAHTPVLGQRGLPTKPALRESPHHLVQPTLLHPMVWSPQAIRSHWDFCQFRETPPPCISTPIHHEFGEGSSWFFPCPFPRAQSRARSCGPEYIKEGGYGVGSLLCPQQTTSCHHPCSWDLFPWVCSVPADPLFCHRNRQLAACSINGHSSPDLPEAPDKHRLCQARPLHSA